MEKNNTTTKKPMRVVNNEAQKKFNIEHEYTMGVCLASSDVKGFKRGKVDISRAWGTIKHNELYIANMRIKGAAVKDEATGKLMEPERKLLEHRKTLDELIKMVFKQKLSIVPLEVFTNEDGLMKIKIGLGKKNPDYVAPERPVRTGNGGNRNGYRGGNKGGYKGSRNSNYGGGRNYNKN